MRKETTNLVFDKIESKVNLKLSKPKIIQFSLNGSFCFTASLLLLWLCDGLLQTDVTAGALSLGCSLFFNH